MCGRSGPRPCRHSGRMLLPESTPPALNYLVITGILTGDPREGRGPAGDPVTLLSIEFLVAHPKHPRLLWTHASYDIEVPSDVGGRQVEELRGGAPVLVSGQLSERWEIEAGRTSRRGVIVATLVKSGASTTGAGTPR